jgi:hypothetical protein
MHSTPNFRARLWAGARAALLILGVLALVLAARTLYALRDRHPRYQLALNLEGASSRAHPRPLRAGFGRVKINPDLSDPARPIWIAGFGQHRAATTLHDDLWAVGCVLDDGYQRVGIVALDAIGFFHDDVIEVRQRLPREWRLDYTVVCSTHNHNTPDLLGLWGPNFLRTGVNPQYRNQVIDGCVAALGEAIRSLQPARLAYHEIPSAPAGLVTDTRKPEVYDPDLRVLHFLNSTNESTLGAMVGWADHPETLWSKNTEITADFPGYLRQALERGLELPGPQRRPGLGGICLYINGAIGGLMSTTPRVVVRDPCLEQDFTEPSHDKARALGRALAARILPRLKDSAAQAQAAAPLAIRARTLELPLKNPGYWLAGILGLIDRGHARWGVLRTEVALLTIGEASVACIPGEIYPEIVNGGVERAPGGDFDLEPVEAPPLRSLMPGRLKFIFGLANDEIGYLIPKSEWDQRPPYLYGSKKALYGEINSVGPDAAPRIYAAIRELCR